MGSSVVSCGTESLVVDSHEQVRPTLSQFMGPLSSRIEEHSYSALVAGDGAGAAKFSEWKNDELFLES